MQRDWDRARALRKRLVDMWNAYMQLPIPHVPEGELEDARLDLLVFDGVSGYLSSVLGRVPVEPRFLQPDRGLEERVARLAASDARGEPLRAYIAQLNDMLELAVQVQEAEGVRWPRNRPGGQQ